MSLYDAIINNSNTCNEAKTYLETYGNMLDAINNLPYNKYEWILWLYFRINNIDLKINIMIYIINLLSNMDLQQKHADAINKYKECGVSYVSNNITKDEYIRNIIINFRNIKIIMDSLSHDDMTTLCNSLKQKYIEDFES